MPQTPVLVLPGPLATAEPPYAGSDGGRRSLSWTVPAPGGLWHRAGYVWAWVEVREGRAWSGEPLRVWAQRRVTDDGPRTEFPPGALAKIEAEVLEAVGRYGFNRLWLDVHRSGHRDFGVDRVERARRELVWHELNADLAAMHVAGLVEFRPLPPGDYLRRRVVSDRQGIVTELMVASAEVAGELVGWVTDGGGLVPDDAVLRG